MKKNTFLAFILMIFVLKAFSQWSDNPMVNTIVNNLPGEQAVPHVAYDADGNFYVGFYSNSSGNYDIRLHYFNYDGVAQWGADGLLVSGNTQNTWVTDWDLTADMLGNCVLAFNDVRDGNTNVFAYAISPAGSFLWGANGIRLTTDPADEYVPSITVTADNNTIVAWSRPASPYDKIVIQKITPDGTLSWGSSGITYQAGAYNYTGARVLGVEGDNFILAFYKETGNFPSLTRHIYAQKFDGSGAAVWASDVLASNSNGISAFTNFYIKSDNANGIVLAWMDDRNSDNNIDCEVQRVLNDGSITWPANGSLVSSETNYSDQNVRILGVTNNNEVIVAWDKKNANQSLTAIAGQKFSATGERQWGEGGKVFIPMSANIFGNARGTIINGTGAMFVYDENTGGTNSQIKVFGTDGSGDFIWSPSITLLASRSTEKSSIVDTDIFDNQMVVAWKEGSSSDIYMQNIFNDGTMGEAPLSNDATLMDLTVNNETVAGFSPTIYTYSVGIPAGDPLPVTGASASVPESTIQITQASSVPGTATVLVIAEDGITQLTYTVNFHVASTDATLSDLTINGTTIEGFAPDVFSYEYTVPTGDPIPLVGATPNEPNAYVAINQAANLPGTASVVVTAEDGIATNTYSVNFLYTPSSDATLSEITVDGISIDGFNPSVYNYNYGVVLNSPLPYTGGTTTDPNASVEVTQCASVPGDAVLLVTAEDGATTLTYTVSFYYMNNDASLSDLTVDNVTIADFDPAVFYYEYFVEPGNGAPTVNGTTTNPLASLTISQADGVPGDAMLTVVAEDGANESIYTVHFYTSSGDASLSDLTVDGMTIEGFEPSTYYYEYDVFLCDYIPIIDGTTTDENASKDVTQATELPGDGTIVVTAQDGISQQTYTVHFNCITSVIAKKEKQISVYPNPATDKLFVSGIDGDFQVEIMNLLGEVFYSGNIADKQSVEVGFLNNGVYFVVLREKGEVLKTLKFLKN